MFAAGPSIQAAKTVRSVFAPRTASWSGLGVPIVCAPISPCWGSGGSISPSEWPSKTSAPIPRCISLPADTLLSVSPLLAGPGLFSGRLEILDGCAAGWVTERIARFEPPDITVLDSEGCVVARARSSLSVQDHPDPNFGPAEFSAPLSDACFGGQGLHLTAFANGVAFASATCTLPFEGHAGGRLRHPLCRLALFPERAEARA